MVACYSHDKAADVNEYALLGQRVSGPDGRFRLEVGQAGNRQLVAYKQGLALGWMTVVESRDLNLVLGKAGRLAGVVVDESGLPVAGAKVHATLYNRVFSGWRGDASDGERWDTLGPRVPEDWFTARTNREGRFALDDIPVDGTADLQVQAPGRALACTSRDGFRRGCQFASGRADVRITLAPEAVIQGQVVDEDSHRPIPGIRLSIRAIGLHARCCHYEPVVSDTEGRFQFRGLAVGRYILQLAYARSVMLEWVGKDMEVTLQAGQALEDVKVPVNKGGILEVLVRDGEDGTVVPGARVRVSQGHEHECLTDANGLSRFRLSAGQAKILRDMGKEGLGWNFSDEEEVMIGKGQTRRCTVDLPHNACTASGRVLDPNGQPVEGAWVRRDWIYTISDNQGRFGFPTTYFSGGPPDGLEFLVRHGPTQRAAKAFLHDPNKDGHVHGEVTLIPASLLTGRVVDPNGRGLPAAYVILMCKYNMRRITQVVTDAKGVYQIPAIPASLSKSNPLTLVARVKGYGTREVSCPAFADADRIVQMDPIVLEPATESVSGVVVDSNDRPVPGSILTVLGSEGAEDLGQPYRQIAADSQGRFRLEGVCKGPLRLSVSAGHLDAVGVAQDLKVVLGRQLVHTGQKSLSGKTLANLAEVGVMCDPNEFRDKAVLVCFIDVGQRPSRNMVQQISKRALADKGIAVFLVQAERTDPNALQQQIKASGTSVPVCAIPGDAEQVRTTWNVQSLPWMILTDRDHVVQAEGLSLEDLDKRLEAASR